MNCSITFEQLGHGANSVNSWIFPSALGLSPNFFATSFNILYSESTFLATLLPSAVSSVVYSKISSAADGFRDISGTRSASVSVNSFILLLE